MGTAARAKQTRDLQRTLGNSRVARMIQRACACGGDAGADGECAECKARRSDVQRKRDGEDMAPAKVPATTQQVLSHGGGSPLDGAARDSMEGAFGTDLGQVRIHTGPTAARAARDLHAAAFTSGQDIYFGDGRFQPDTREGQRLLAHELTHTVQQRGALSVNRFSVSRPDDPEELEAEDVATRLAGSSGGNGGSNGAAAVSNRTAIQRVMLQRFPCTAGTLTDARCSDAQGAGRPAGVILEHFEMEKDRLKPTHVPTVAAFTVSWIAAGSRDDVEVHGFASCDGVGDFNVQLSCARAAAVTAQLIRTGVTGRITTFAHGETDAFGPSLDANRRVIITSIPRPAPVPPTPVPPPAPPGCTAPTNRDRSGRADNPTTDGENTVALFNFIDAIDALGCRDDAFAAAAASGLPGPHLGPQDAFRHCFWNCCMGQEMGASEAEKFGTGHENSNPSSIPFDNQMDLHDNAIGRGLGAPGADCAADCASAVSSGRLRTIRGPSTAASATPPVTTDCIGESNQPWP